jgi:hypothetical protein
MKIRKPTPAGSVFAGVIVVLSLALVPAAFAGKGGNNGPSGGGSSTITGPVMVTDLNGDGLPNYGDTVTFNVATTATATPYVDLTCSQNGVVVLSATWGDFASYPWPWTKDMNLASQMYTGGQAACVATLYTFNSRAKKQILATLPFTAFA